MFSIMELFNYTELNILRSISNDLKINIEYSDKLKWWFEFEGRYGLIESNEFDSEIDCIRSSIINFKKEFFHSESLFDHYYEKGWKYYDKGNYQEAKNHFLKSLVLAGGNDDVKENYTVIGVCECRIGNFDISLKYLNIGVNLKGAYFAFDPYWERAKLHLIMGNYSSAIVDLQKLENFEKELLDKQEIELLKILSPLIDNMI